MATNPKFLLCIEDDEDDCVLIEEAAAEVDPELVFIHKCNGKEGMTFLQMQKEFNDFPCLIVMDLNMPVMNGKETLARIKNDPELKKIPIVVFSTTSNKADHFYCEQHGAELITKPYKMEELKKRIQQVIVARCN